MDFNVHSCIEFRVNWLKCFLIEVQFIREIIPINNLIITITFDDFKYENEGGTVLFFVCITIYLYGDLAIYGAAIGKSLRDTACTYYPPGFPCNETLNGTIPCWDGVDLTRDNAYRLFLVGSPTKVL